MSPGTVPNHPQGNREVTAQVTGQGQELLDRGGVLTPAATAPGGTRTQSKGPRGHKEGAADRVPLSCPHRAISRNNTKWPFSSSLYVPSREDPAKILSEKNKKGIRGATFPPEPQGFPPGSPAVPTGRLRAALKISGRMEVCCLQEAGGALGGNLDVLLP